MTDTLTPFQIFFSLSVMNKIYPLSFFRRLCNIKAGGKKKMCISNLYIMKPLNLRLRLWDRSCVVTSHFEVQYNKYKLECLHVFFFLSLSLQEEEAYPIEFIEINIPQGFFISPLNTVLYTFSN